MYSTSKSTETKQHSSNTMQSQRAGFLSKKALRLLSLRKRSHYGHDCLQGPRNRQDRKQTRGHFSEAMDSRDTITMLLRGDHGLYIPSGSHTQPKTTPGSNVTKAIEQQLLDR